MGISGDKRAITFQVTGDPTRALQTARAALEAQNFRVTAEDQWTLKAARGSRAMALLAGALAPYVEVSVIARSMPQPGITMVELDQLPAGCAYAGGLLGARRSRNRVDAVRDQLHAAFVNAGVLYREGEQ